MGRSTPTEAAPYRHNEIAANRTAEAAERTKETAVRTTVAAQRTEATADRRTELRVLASGSLRLPGSGYSHCAKEQLTPTDRAAPSPPSGRRCRSPR